MNRQFATWLRGLTLATCIIFVAPIPAAEAVDAAEAQLLLERLIAGMHAGEPPAADLTERLRAAMARPDAPPFPTVLGPVQAVQFDSASPDGNNFTFIVDHANGRMKWVLMYEEGERRIYNLSWEQLPPFRPLPIEVGEEIASTLEHGVPGKYGPNIPVGAYRFVGREGQRVCARVASTDDYVHVYLADSMDPSAAPLYSSWLQPYFDTHYPNARAPVRSQGTSFMATLPRSGEYYLYVLAHGHAPHTERHSRPSQRYLPSLPVNASGAYALKLWDADRPEPLSRDSELARTQHPGSMEPTWLGNIAYLLDVPYVSDMTATAMQFALRDGSIVQHQASIETGVAHPEWVFSPTGRRGEYRLGDGRTLQVQCDGTWTLGTGASLHFTTYGGNGSERHFTPMPRGSAPLYAWSPAQSTELIAPADYWTPSNPQNIAGALEALGYRREEAQQRLERQARRAAEDQANRQAMMAGILGGFASGLAEETADQQYAQDQYEDAVQRGQQQGLAIRRAQAASDALSDRAIPESPPRAASDATPGGVAVAVERTGTGADTSATLEDPASNSASKPLQFVLTISMRNLPGDAHNSMCYSNVITRPGPPGWGAPGFLPSGSAEQALSEINALKDEFIAACRRSGREITSEGNFSHVRNQSQGDEQRVHATQPRFAEDVSVVLN